MYEGANIRMTFLCGEIEDFIVRVGMTVRMHQSPSSSMYFGNK